MEFEYAYKGMRVFAKRDMLLNSEGEYCIAKGSTGTIISRGSDRVMAGVQWDILKCGHDLSGELPHGSHDGYYVYYRSIEPYIEDEDIVCPNEIDFSEFMGF